MSTTFFIIFSAICGLLGFVIGWLVATLKAQINYKTHMQSMMENNQYNEQHLSQLFEGISAKTLQHNSNSYIQQTNQHLQHILNPLYTNLQKLEKQIHDIEHKRTEAYTGMHKTVSHLSDDLKQLQQSNKELNDTTSKLNQALRSNHSTRGKWGEIQLRRIAEITGMQEHIDFEEQVHSSQKGNTSRPDMIIRMPQDGIIPVDAKTPMNAYLNAINAQNEDEKAHYLNEHKKALITHIKDLSKKEYWNQFSHAPQLVVLFVPYESGLEASLSQSPELLDQALSNKVIVAGPSTLYALLKVISYGWMQLSLSKNTEEIYNISKTLFERFNVFYKAFNNIGNSLNKAVDSFNTASNSLASRFIPTLRQIHEKSASEEEIVSAEHVLQIDTHANESYSQEAAHSPASTPQKKTQKKHEVPTEYMKEHIE